MSLPFSIGNCSAPVNTRSVIYYDYGTNPDSDEGNYPQNFSSYALDWVNNYDMTTIPWGGYVYGTGPIVVGSPSRGVITGSGTHFESNASWVSTGTGGGPGSWVYDGQLIRTQVSLAAYSEMCPPSYMVICYESYSTYVNGQLTGTVCCTQLGCTSQVAQGLLIIDLPVPPFLDPSMGLKGGTTGIPGYTVSYYFALVGSTNPAGCPITYPNVNTFVSDYGYSCQWDDALTCINTTGSNYNSSSICTLGNPFPSFVP
jgi:hypothetical protein